nr:BglG family transcription antiterminator [Exiguobacterium sp. s22]
MFAETPDSSISTKYIPSENERASLILLMMLTSKEELSLLHFSSAMETSRNTSLRDIKVAQKQINDYQLEIVYSRIYGYDLVGEEWDKRRLLIDVLNTLFDMYQGEYHIQHFADVTQEEIQHCKFRLDKVESQLELKFIDDRIKLLPYVIAILLKRIQAGHVIKTSYFIEYEALSDTKEYEAAELLLEDGVSISKQERLFITLQLLTSNVFSSQSLAENELPQLRNAMKQSLQLFEKKAALSFKDKEALLERLMLHMRPAYYRIKYGLTTNYSKLNRVSENFKAVHFIVKDSLQPLQEYMECEIPENEITFITVLIGGHVISSGETIPLKKRAVVVCPNGISISQLMERTLRDLFPELYFYRAFSTREFEKLDVEFDLVFSPVPLQTDKQLFIVQSFISDFEKVQLRQRVMQNVFGLVTPMINTEQILSIVEKYASIHDRPLLENALQNHFSLQLPSEMKQKEDYLLSEVITPETMIVRDSIASWHDAIELAAQPLLSKGAITENYVEVMKHHYPMLSQHILLNMNVAIPHGRPEDGVNFIGMSMLRVNDGILIEDGSVVHFVVVIATVDKNRHLNALLQLMKLAGHKKDMDRMLHSRDENDMHLILREYDS